jgi:alpha-ketoglutarate-dependent taurine dioxygenase
MTAATTESIFQGKRAPLCITRQRATPHLHEFVATNRSALEAKLTEHGAILFRGFGIESPVGFSDFVAATGGRSIDYRFRSTPRKLVTGQIYTSTEYPANREIPLHNENAYLDTWPYRLAFFCLAPATQGGETPLADMREVVKSIGPALMERFEEEKVQYMRCFHKGFDLPWSEVFQTADPVELGRLCDAHGIQHDWLGADRELLRTVQNCQGVAYHPITAERLFFNQAHLFHASSVGQEVANVMRETFGVDRLPRHSRYADGTEIPDDDIARIHSAFKMNETAFRWQPGDVLWIDNMQIAHGRRPFRGERRILAALMEPSDTVQTCAPRRSVPTC